ncbi:hypothetical protein ZHAS_00008427 [Anopheles sinensis]|uniref:Uncharacterized protein n=1 Tax=Anopheles sinensis TaxID=74873 RepID=A0A084VSF4_ANOSI|nr:hypothetical protein ZHAS_00008427 [Anopheles sinensis]
MATVDRKTANHVERNRKKACERPTTVESVPQVKGIVSIVRQQVRVYDGVVVDYCAGDGACKHHKVPFAY